MADLRAVVLAATEDVGAIVQHNELRSDIACGISQPLEELRGLDQPSRFRRRHQGILTGQRDQMQVFEISEARAVMTENAG